MDPRVRARDLLQKQSISFEKLWLLYWSNGGDAGPVEFDAFIHGIDLLTQFDWTCSTVPCATYPGDESLPPVG
jgi:hypothetical protein